MRFHRIAQAVSLTIFLALLASAATGLLPGPGHDLYLQLDPVLVGLSALAGRLALAALIPAGVVVVFTLLFGRVFCGTFCPMGITLDVSDRCVKRRKGASVDDPRLRPVKYYVLAFLTACALVGVSLISWASPLSWITRFYGLVVYPAAGLVSEEVWKLSLPLAERLSWTSWIFAEWKVPHFAGQFVTLGFLALLFGSGRFASRFWCRYVCPSGALLSLASIKPLVRRKVAEACIDCGRCSRECPMGAIPEDDLRSTRHAECIVCRKCESVCPVSAVSFGAGIASGAGENFVPARRRFLAAGAAGAGTAVIGLTSLGALAGQTKEGRVAPAKLIRPPAARPETEFLAACVRCGECMTACPTNTLQPLWLEMGFIGVFSPAITPRRGYCDPLCHRCADVCPTQAIRRISLKDRLFAKTGTAIIRKEACLAWDQGKSCMVCDEVCPFDAIDFLQEPGRPVAVPYVRAEKCAGCGYCEHFCPVKNAAAIEVTPMNEIRLSSGSYEQTAREKGYRLVLKPPNAAAPTQTAPPEGGAPGFTRDSPETDGLAPGFSPDPDNKLQLVQPI